MTRTRKLGTLLAAAIPVLILALAPAAPATAHSALRDQNPGDGETIVTAPAAVSLGFNEDLIDAGTAVTVTGTDGQQWTEGTPTVLGSELEQPLATEIPADTYTVVWRVVSADGHPIDGTFDFTVSVGVDAPAEPVATETAEPAPEVTDTPTPSASEDPVADDSPEVSTVALIVVTALLLIATPILAFTIIRRRRRD